MGEWSVQKVILVVVSLLSLSKRASKSLSLFRGDISGCGGGVAGFVVTDGLDALPHVSRV